MKHFLAALSSVFLFLGGACAQPAAPTSPSAQAEPAAEIAASAPAIAPVKIDAQTDQMTGGAVGEDTRVAPESMAAVRASFAPIVDRVGPSVVNIYTSRTINRTTGDTFFDQFFGRAGPRTQTSLGSGVIVSPDGVIVTNNHVIEDMTEIKVVFADRREFDAELLLTDPQTDLAVLKIDAGETLPFMVFANSDAAEVGDIVLAIGNPFGVGQTVTSGIVSALARTEVSISDFQFFIQTDAAINPGNSGGALVDVNGQLLGVNTAIFSRSGGSNGIGFAIPARLVQQVIASAMRGGAVIRPWTGATTETVTSTMASAIGLDRPAGAIVNDLYKGGPFDKAGLKSGDVIIELDGNDIPDAATLRYRVGILDDGAEADVVYVRNGKQRTGKVALKLPPETPAPDERVLEGEHPMRSVAVVNLSPRFNEELGINPLLSGVQVLNAPRRSYAGRKGLRRGHRIVAVNGKKIRTTADLNRELSKPVARWDIDVDTGDRVVSWCTTRSGRRCR